MRGLGGAVGVVVASMAIGGQAWAATIEYEEDPANDQRVVYTADAQESNRVTVNCCDHLLGRPGVLFLTDPGAAIAVGPSADSREHCLAALFLAECGASGTGPLLIDYLDVHLGPKPDTVRLQRTDGFVPAVFGGGGGDTLVAGDSPDYLDGGAGPDGIHSGASLDTIEARDGTRDNITCGMDDDTVFADPVDSIADSCENVQIG